VSCFDVSKIRTQFSQSNEIIILHPFVNMVCREGRQGCSNSRRPNQFGKDDILVAHSRGAVELQGKIVAINPQNCSAVEVRGSGLFSLSLTV
jgi:hypothetical protein